MTKSAPEAQLTESKQLEGMVAIVTGASSGIGAATAVALAQAGARLSLLARREDKLVALSDQIADQKLHRPIQFVTDVADQGQVAHAVAETIKQFSRIDILINNAGVMYLGPVDGADPNDWRRMFEINVLGLMYSTHAVLPIMKRQKSGHIVNISSVSGKVVSSRSAAYSATKFAVGAFSEGLRQEVTSSKIKVTTIAPGAVATELTDHITHAETQKSVKDWVSTMSALSSEDIANAILYAVCQPPSVNVNEIVVRPTDQAF